MKSKTAIIVTLGIICILTLAACGNKTGVITTTTITTSPPPAGLSGSGSITILPTTK